MNLNLASIGLFALLMLFEQIVDAGPLPDPTRPAVTAPPAQNLPGDSGAATDWSLSMLRLSGNQPVALLNGRFLKPGDEFRGARVVAISRTGVELLHNGERVLVSLPGRAVKQVSK